MRRLLTDAWAYAAGLAGSSRAGWNAFFFTPADPTALGLIRLGVGLLLLWDMAVRGFDLTAHFGATGWADPDTVRLMLTDQPSTIWSFWFLVPDSALVPAWLGCLAVLALFAAGLFSKVTAPLAWAIAVSTARRAPVLVFGFDQVVSTWALYLAATAASGQAVSLDRLLARWRLGRAEAARRRRDGSWNLRPGRPEPTISANIALRLIQLHIALIYGIAGLAKLQGQPWWTGDAGWGVVAAGEFRLFDLTWMVAFPWLIQLGTHLGLLLELCYPVLVWVRALRPLIIGATVLMHVGIGLTLGLTEFSLAMIAGNLAFVDGRWLRSLLTGRDAGQPAGKVLYDGACPYCRGSMAALTAFDPDRVVEPVDLTAVELTSVHPSLDREACLRAMHLVDRRGTIRVGYDAVIRLAWWLPPLWPLAAFGSLPGVSAVGRVVYQRVADARPRDVPCTDDVCGLQPPPAAAQTGRGSDLADTGRNAR